MAEITEQKNGNNIIVTVRNGKYFLRFEMEIKGKNLHINHVAGTGVGFLVRTGLSKIREIAKKNKLQIESHVIEDPHLVKLSRKVGFRVNKKFDSTPYDELVTRMTLSNKSRRIKR